jgi:hypothetical protein
MDGETLSRLDRLIWATVAMVAVVVIAAPLVSHFQIGWDTFIAPALACTILSAGSRFYSRWRRDPRLASGLLCTAQVIAFAAVGAPLSYIAASANAPLWDHGLDMIDRALGLDWKGLLAWMNASPAIYALLRPIYLSLTLQMTAVVLCLAFSSRFLRLRVYTLAFIIAVLISIAVSAVLPAAGAWPYYGLAGADLHIVPAVSPSWPVFYGLRDGTFRLLVAVGSEGIITFPSVHAALAVIVVGCALAHCGAALGVSRSQCGNARGHAHRRLALFHRRARRDCACRAIPPAGAVDRGARRFSCAARARNRARGGLTRDKSRVTRCGQRQ